MTTFQAGAPSKPKVRMSNGKREITLNLKRRRPKTAKPQDPPVAEVQNFWKHQPR